MPRSAPRTRGGSYLLTWTTYGTWLPGHDKGFVGRVPTAFGSATHNRPGTPFDRSMPSLAEAARARMRGEPVVMNASRAHVCERSFLEVASSEEIAALAFAIMATHVHVVVRSWRFEGQELLRRFKGVSSRRLSQAFGKLQGGRWWSQHGSRRLLTTNGSLRAAIRCVLKQERPLMLWRRDEPETRRAPNADQAD